MKHTFTAAFLLAFVLIPGFFSAQRGKDGAETLTNPGVIFNRYTQLTTTAPAGSSTIEIALITVFLNGNYFQFAGPQDNPYTTNTLTPGDLLLLIKMQGATMDINNNANYGAVLNYNGVGNYEFIEVGAVNGRTITLANGCTLQKNYVVSATERVQVVRVPRLTSLTINAGASLTSPAWSEIFSKTGGVVAVEVSGNTIINGVLTTKGKGFKGGQVDNSAGFYLSDYVSINPADGAEKGEGIAGDQNDYDNLGGRYCKGAPANGGGGGNTHNAGGGGGSNGDNGLAYNGNGSPSLAGIGWSGAWNLESANFALKSTSGGGRGGYSYSNVDGDAWVDAPGDGGAWGGDARRIEGGFGGRPLDHLGRQRIFFGGGGGAGDANNNNSQDAADGGGIVFIICEGNITGTGTVNASGNDAPGTINAHDDAAGGGGGGGSIVALSGGNPAGVTFLADGGNGGSQGASVGQAEGPGGGGGGGFIVTMVTPSIRSVNGGNNGTTGSPMLSEFIPNGATRGTTGEIIAPVAFTHPVPLKTDLSVAAITNSPSCIGQQKTFTVVVTNESEFMGATNVTVTIPTPAGVTFTGSGVTAGTYNNPQWVVASLNAGVSETLTLTGVVTATNIAAFTPTASSAWAECVTSNNTVSIPSSTVIQVVLTASSNPTVICAGATSTLTGSGAASYTWSPGNSTLTGIAVTPTAGTYVYTLTGATGACSNSTTLSLTVHPNPTVSASASPTVICKGNASTLTATGANTYTWNTGSSSSSIVVTPTVNASYTVTGTNTLGGCTHSVVRTVSVNAIPSLSISPATATLCSGSTATLTASGSNTYAWSTGASVSTIAVTPTTNTSYTVTGTNTLSGCTNSLVRTVSVSTTPTVSVSPSTVSICSGNSATLTSSGANTYTWSTGSNSSSIAVTPTTTLSYTVTGTNTLGGCTRSVVRTVTVYITPTVSVLPGTVTICSGRSTTLTSSGATTYTWNPGAYTGSSVSLTPGATTNYTVTGTNTLGGCTHSVVRTVSVNTTPTVSASPTLITICSGNSAALNSSGASTYTWNPGTPGSSISVTPGSTTVYTVTGTNTLGGCTNSAMATVSVNTTPTVAVSPGTVNICTGNSVALNSSGANTYTWSNGTQGSSLAVSPGATTVYTVTGTNTLGGCSNSAIATVSVNSTPPVAVSPNTVTICSGNTVSLASSGADTFTWNPGGLTGNSVMVSPVATTMYTVTGTNTLGGCMGSVVATVSVNTTPALSVSPNTVSICSGGSATLSVSGAGTYTWNPGALTGWSIAVTPGSTTVYTVTGTNTLGGCTNSSAATVSVNTTPLVAISPNTITICSGNTAALNSSGANTYTWNPGALTGSVVTVSPNGTTIYTVTGTNTLGGCTNSAVSTVSVNSTPSLNVSATSSTLCAGAATTLNAQGANVYAWNPGALSGTSVTVSPPATTVYSVSGIGANGCSSAVYTINITVNANPTVSAGSNTAAVCFGQSAVLTASGAVSYVWNPGALPGTPVSVSPPASTVYTLTGTNGAGCTDTKTISLPVNSNPTVNVSANAPVICYGQTTALSATGAASYTWYPVLLNGSTVAVAPGTNATYTVTGTSNAGCTDTQTVGVVVHANPTLTATQAAPYICEGKTAALSATGAVTYTWNPGFTSGATISVTPLSSIVYSVTGTNSLGCSSTETLQVNVSPTPVLTLVATETLICFGQKITLTASGAGTYTWSPGEFSGNTMTASPAATAVYVVTGTSSLGCVSLPAMITVSATNACAEPVLGLAKAAGMPVKLEDGTYDITYTITVKNMGNEVLKNVQVKDDLDHSIPLPATYYVKTEPFVTGSLTTNPLYNGTSDVNLLNSALSKIAPGAIETIIITVNVNTNSLKQIRNSASGTAMGSQSGRVVSDISGTGFNPDINENNNPNEPRDNDPTVTDIPEDTDIVLPQGFSPNNDGVNDFFVIPGISRFPNSNLKILNRWGNVVFEADGYDNTWNGKSTIGVRVGGEDLPDGTYFYFLDLGVQQKAYKGFVYLNRATK